MQCYICGDETINRHSRSNLCAKHNRFIQMQKTAKADKKYVPCIFELEKVAPKSMECQDCGATMTWIDLENRALNAVLQHYRNKTIGIVCMSCNTKHGMMPGDSYRDVPNGHKLCRYCKTIKPLDMFYKRGDSKKPYPMTKCKKCNLYVHRLWRLNNPEKYIASNKKANDLRKKKGVKIELNSI